MASLELLLGDNVDFEECIMSESTTSNSSISPSSSVEFEGTEVK